MTLIPSLTFTDYEWFPWSICNGCGMPAGNAYLQDTWFRPILGLANAPIVETKLPNLPCLYSTFHLEYPLVLSRFCFTDKSKGIMHKCQSEQYLYNFQFNNSRKLRLRQNIPFVKWFQGRLTRIMVKHEINFTYLDKFIIDPLTNEFLLFPFTLGYWRGLRYKLVILPSTLTLQIKTDVK